MAGHSQFKNIMYRKGAQDKKRAKIFSRLGREIAIAAKLGGPDPAANPRLRSAIAAARKENMPKDNIERAIKKGGGGDDGAAFEEVRYEGYGPGGVALIVEALTDNRNRTTSEVRSAFSKFGGSLGETNSVAFMFERLGEIVFPAEAGDADTVFEAAIDAGASDIESDATSHTIYCAPDDLHTVAEALGERFGDPERAKLAWRPTNTVQVAAQPAETLLKLLDTLDDSDDVQTVHANFEIDDAEIARLTG